MTTKEGNQARAGTQGKVDMEGTHFGHRLLAFVGIALLSALIVACDDIPYPNDWNRIVEAGDPHYSTYPPEWTADGQHLMFRHQRRTGSDIFVVKSDGSGLKRIFKESEKDKYSLPDISPDGSRIVYATTRHTFNKREEDNRLDLNLFRNWEIETAELKGSDKRRLTFDLVTQDHSPAWSPDGSRIAFVTSTDSPDPLFLTLNVIAEDGSGNHPIVRGRNTYPVGTTGKQEVSRDSSGRDTYGGEQPGQEVITDISLKYGPVWSPDGSKLAYVVYEHVYSVNADGSGLSRLSEKGSPSRYVLYSVNADGSGLSRLFTKDKILGAPGWSPDGTRLAVVSIDVRAGGREHVARLNIVSADGSGILDLSGSRFVGSGAINFRDPGVSWSPDGAEILYVTFKRLGNPSSLNGILHIANEAGGSVRKLDTWASFASWSPDGSRIAVISDDTSSYLSTVAPDGTDARVLVRVDNGGNLRAAK